MPGKTESSDEKLSLKRKAKDCSVDPKSCKSLRDAAQQGAIEAVKYFVEEKKANVNGHRYTGVVNSPLCDATVENHLEVVKYLVEKKANVNKKCLFNMSALHQAAYKNRLEIFKFLVENGADIRMNDVSGNTPLHVAIISNNIDMVKYILNRPHVDVNDINADRNTPLHLAAQHSSLEMVKLLLEHKANPEILNKSKETALELAKKYSKNDISEYLASQTEFERRSLMSGNENRKLYKREYNLPYEKSTFPSIKSKGISSSHVKSTHSDAVEGNTIASDVTYIFNSLFLLDLVVRYFTKQKYVGTENESTSESDTQVTALKMIETFEQLQKFYSSVKAEDVVWTDVHSNIYKVIQTDNTDEIHKIFCSYFDALSNLPPEKNEELMSTVMANNPNVKVPEPTSEDIELLKYSPFFLTASCFLSPQSTTFK